MPNIYKNGIKILSVDTLACVVNKELELNVFGLGIKLWIRPKNSEFNDFNDEAWN